jgi:DNA-binding response OmpR family regulator
MKVLVVEDEAPTAAFLRRGLGEEGFAVDVAADAEQADEAVSVNDYDVVVLDVMLPGGDGFALCEEWRERGLRTPVLFLTARDDVRDRVRGLNLGGDDYLVKPFAFEELLARVRALVRRGAAGEPAPVLRVGELALDTNARTVTRGGRQVHLTAREYQLLEYLARNPGRVVTRADLWEHVWESHATPDSNAVDVYVGYLRSKLGRKPEIIRTVRGAGYVLDPSHAPEEGTP